MFMRLMFGITVLSAVGCGRTEVRSLRNTPSELALQSGSIKDYQIGPTWGKKVVTKDLLSRSSAEVQRAAKATASVKLGFGGATAFVIGEKEGEIRLATNNHVIGSQGACSGARIAFPLLEISGLTCKKVIGTWTDIDLTVFTISGYSEAQKTKMLSVARNFAFRKGIRKGQELVTAGFGFAGNSNQNMMIEMDDDCKVYSKDNEARYMKDPDEVNPGPYMTWLFSTGCDVSHGDSGSAIVDRKTGDVIGILSTGRIPKNSLARDRDWLDDAFVTGDDRVWEELTFVVPAFKILEIAGSDVR